MQAEEGPHCRLHSRFRTLPKEQDTLTLDWSLVDSKMPAVVETLSAKAMPQAQALFQAFPASASAGSQVQSAGWVAGVGVRTAPVSNVAGAAAAAFEGAAMDAVA